jgi:hypothetical protein
MKLLQMSFCIQTALRYQTLGGVGATLTATCDRRSNPDQFRRSPVAPSAPLRQVYEVASYPE